MRKMSVWYQLDLIAGPDLRKRIDGIQDIQNWLKNFAKKGTGAPHHDGSNVDPLSFDETTGYGGSETCLRSASSLDRDEQKDEAAVKENGEKKPKKKKKKKKVVKKIKKNKVGPKNDPDLPIDYGNVIDCSFNLPRISARLERLMGTNVVRLTDRKYMNDLRERIQDDYLKTLQKRIEAREAKEMERERNLIMTGKGDKIPIELANHPAFLVNQNTNEIIGKRRAKLKTTREKNADRLLRQGAKWERERLIYDEMERQKEKEREEFLMQREKDDFKEESERGDSLRITDQVWDICEIDLRGFMEGQRSSIEKRLELQGQQYSNDPKEISNIVQARRKFRETEQRIRSELEEQIKPSLTNYSIKDFLAKSAAGSIASRRQAEQDFLMAVKAVQEAEWDKEEDAEKDKEVKIVLTAADEEPSEDDEQTPSRNVSPTSPPDSQEGSVKGGQRAHVLSKAEYDMLHYEDPNVMRLKQANNVHELYELAEEIIIGEPIAAS